MKRLQDGLAERIAPFVLANVTTRYPYHDSHLFLEGGSAHDPVVAHPAFGNSFDWHSSVHSHWTAVQLLAHFTGELPDEFASLEDAVRENLTAEKIAGELAYVRQRGAYERPYGWAWALLLASDVPVLAPLADWLATAAIGWMNLLTMPVRHGIHSNSAFAMGLMHDAAVALRFDELRATIETKARDWFGSDTHWAVRYERSGSDFLSPGLVEADLMRRVYATGEFARWWVQFLPELDPSSPILRPVDVPGVSDGHVVHLHGLNLSRAAILARISTALTDAALLTAACELYDASVARAYTGHYSETHWLPTFAWDAARSIDRARSA